LFITQICSCQFAILGPMPHCAHISTVITINNLHSAVSFNWRDSFGSQEFNHGMLLKVHRRVLSAGFHFTHNSNTTSYIMMWIIWWSCILFEYRTRLIYFLLSFIYIYTCFHLIYCWPYESLQHLVEDFFWNVFVSYWLNSKAVLFIS
jgi:hypothetical protein